MVVVHPELANVITGVLSAMRVAQEETLGRLLRSLASMIPIMPYERRTTRIHGLATNFYAYNLKRIWRVAEALEYGMVGINTGRM
ncbi:hypothetical protein AJ87_20895 [Rhizobium yanglingense]|nr:hypothetical protein AJ87_20895 [Rhizobium yanglingense]